MINVSDYIVMILEKKKWSRVRFCDEINRIEAKIGERKTNPPDITNYLNGRWALRPKMLAKWEKALDLREGTLVNMVMPPITKEGKDELKETINRLRKV